MILPLAALMLGVCAAAEPVPAEAATPAQLECLGARSISPRDLQRSLEPLDVERPKLSDDEITGLVLAGYRIDAGRVLDRKTGRPITRLDYACLKRGDAAYQRRDALERRAVARAPKPGRAYLALTRLLDDHADAGDFVVGAQPLPAPKAQVLEHPFFDDAESRLSDALRTAVAARLSANPVGARLLERFRNASGELELPIFLVAPIADTYYDRGRVIMSLDAVGLSATDLPEDFKGAVAYLASHPEVLTACLSHDDDILAHELVHAEQNRRDLLWSEIDRGNFPDATYLETEEEAERVKMAYIHEKLKADPAAAVDAATLADYRLFVSDLDAWKARYDRRYLAALPGRAATVAAGERIQLLRERASQALVRGDPAHRGVEKLKLQGFELGRRAAADFTARQKQDWADFTAGDYPRIQAESNPLLARVYIRMAETETGAELRGMARERAREYARAAGDPGLIRLSAELR